MTQFNELGIIPPILKAVQDLQYQNPTEIQSTAIPTILKNQDLVVVSKTGSGKTAVFGIPLLQMTDPNIVEPQALVLTPTRELAVQVNGDIQKLAKYLDHKTVAVYGKHNMNTEVRDIEKGVQIIVGTPGRVYDHITRNTINTKSIKYLVLDEADRMLDMGFIIQVRKIMRYLNKQRTTLLFSATFPTEIRRLSESYMNNPEYIEIESETKTVDTIKQEYFRVEREEKLSSLETLLKFIRPESCLIFCNTRVGSDRILRHLSRKGYNARVLHGDVPQNTRLRTMNQFKKGEFSILIATDVAARGIHINDLSLVVNYDVPVEKDAYIHRIGRTGRAGQGGHAVTFVTNNDIYSFYEIEEHVGMLISESDLPDADALNQHKDEISAWLESNKKKHPKASSKPMRQTQSQPKQKSQPKPQRPQGQKPDGEQNKSKPMPQPQRPRKSKVAAPDSPQKKITIVGQKSAPAVIVRSDAAGSHKASKRGNKQSESKSFFDRFRKK